MFAGFSVYPCLNGYQSNGEFLPEFVCHWRFKIDGQAGTKSQTSFKKSDIDTRHRMVDIVFENEIHVRAHQKISIMVRFVDETNFMAFTQLGYGGESY